MKSNSRYEVNTPTGWESFEGIQKLTRNTQYILRFNNNEILTCSSTHRVFTVRGWAMANNLVVGDEVISSGGVLSLCNIHIEEGLFDFYDLLEVGKNKQYYTNTIISHNCEFIGSSNTLISATKLRLLRSVPPLTSNHDSCIFVQPIDQHQYFVVVDTARGVQGDFSAFVVFDVSELPYKIVASYKNNMISPMLYPNIVFQFAKHYHDAYVLVETNDIGEQIANILHHDLEYGNILTTINNGRSGQIISQGFGQHPRLGVRTTKQVKRIGCLGLKTQIESDKLLINDERILYELFRFVNIGDSYEAEEGHDDLVMCCVLFAWAMGQADVKELTSVDLRHKLEQENEDAMEENLLPFGIISRGMIDAPIVFAAKKGNDSWLFAKDDDYDVAMMEKHKNRMYG